MNGDSENDRNYVESLVAHTAKPILDAETNRQPHVLLPEGWKLEDLSKRLPAPFRPEGKAKLDDTASFCAYVNAIASDKTNIYCKADYEQGPVVFTAVFNDHTKASPGWRDYGAVYTMPPSIEWKRWAGKNRFQFTQEDFALFLEDNMRDVASVEGMPSGGDMLSMALALEVNQDARLKSSVRLQSGGVELVYVDQENDETLKKMKIFDRFAIGIPPFWNGPAYRIDARLRYRAKDGRVTFWYELIRTDLVVSDAVKDAIKVVTTTTGKPVWFGNT